MSTQILIVIMILLFFHWVADFLFQTECQANNKSKSWKALLYHTSVYTLTMWIFTVMCVTNTLFTTKYRYSILIFVAALFVSHTIIDYVSSRVTSKLYKDENFRRFFDVIGFDQYLHYLCIFLSYSLLFV